MIVKSRGNPRRHGYGWIRDTPDQHDQMYGDFRSLRPIGALPRKADLKSLCHPIRDQGQQGSCVGHGTAANFEIVRAKDFGKGKPEDAFDASRAFIYYEARLTEGMEGEDAGAMIRDGVRVCVRMGVPIEQNFPYSDKVFNVAPPQEVVDQASHFQVTQYMRIRNTRLIEMLNCIADGYAFVIGLTLYESFESTDVALTGNVPTPKWGEQMLGGHCMCAIGYDQDAKVFLVRNSWSAKWGMGGYCVIPFEYLTSRSMAADFWTMRAIEPAFAKPMLAA